MKCFSQYFSLYAFLMRKTHKGYKIFTLYQFMLLNIYAKYLENLFLWNTKLHKNKSCSFLVAINRSCNFAFIIGSGCEFITLNL